MNLVDSYSRPGAITAATQWYRAGPRYVAATLGEIAPSPQERIAAPTYVLWQDLDRLSPRSWVDRLHEFFVEVTVRYVDGVGHYIPVEAPSSFAGIVSEALSRMRNAG